MAMHYGTTVNRTVTCVAVKPQRSGLRRKDAVSFRARWVGQVSETTRFPRESAVCFRTQLLVLYANKH